MACVPIPTVELPTLPAPLTIDPPPLPAVDLSVDFCCKLLTLDVSLAIPPLSPLILNPTVILLINTNIQALQAYIDALPLACPRG